MLCFQNMKLKKCVFIFKFDARSNPKEKKVCIGIFFKIGKKEVGKYHQYKQFFINLNLKDAGFS